MVCVWGNGWGGGRDEDKTGPGEMDASRESEQAARRTCSLRAVRSLCQVVLPAACGWIALVFSARAAGREIKFLGRVSCAIYFFSLTLSLSSVIFIGWCVLRRSRHFAR